MCNNVYLPIMYAGGNPFPPFIMAGPPAVMAPANTGPFQPLAFAKDAALYWVPAVFIGTIGLEYPILEDPSPGGADSPGGGPLAVLKFGPPSMAPFIPCIPP